MTIRNAAVAGTFYPSDEGELYADVNRMLNATTFPKQADVATYHPKALILPHAGYIYSGSVAAKGYRLLEGVKNSINRVVILGPSHSVAFRGIALPRSDYFSTPLGQIAVDQQAYEQLHSISCVFQSDEAHLHEHSLEVHLPFLQVQLNRFKLIPLVVGDATASEVADVIRTYIDLDDVLIIVSTDLSHFLDYKQAQQTDRQTSELICDKFTEIKGHQACGSRPLNGILKLAKEQDLQVEELAVCNSGDTAGDKSRVVGYGAYVVY